MVPNWAFALGMLLQALVAQLEYFRMAIIRGARPARRIVMAASIAAMAVAAGAPALHELVFPVGATWMMLWLCLMRKHASSIQDISTSLMGLFYTAYLPSFWAVWWTALTVAVSDIGAYFGGKRFGRHSLAALGLGAAAEASPNKTIEGAISGFVAAGLCFGLGARAMGWPLWPLSGVGFGVTIAMLALLGDLTASMLKRGGRQDWPPGGPGGVLDRLDGASSSRPSPSCCSRASSRRAPGCREDGRGVVALICGWERV
ncbi:hypothetical protein JL722_10520 [Aureococcus anophagefferens]|nr:hypothetical protein JL722_10520 [Aureococcus anophagefferens]